MSFPSPLFRKDDSDDTCSPERRPGREAGPETSWSRIQRLHLDLEAGCQSVSNGFLLLLVRHLLLR